jgi:hypothetical protein
MARGASVFGSKGFDDADRLQNLMLPCEGLRQWSRDHGLTLDDAPPGLKKLDERLDSWNSDVTHHGKVDLSNEVGIYLGNVIIKHVEGSQWTVWPNGHPIILLRSGTEIDVTRLTNERLNHSGPSLDTIYDRAQAL